MSQEKQHIWILEDDPGCQFVYKEILSDDFLLTFFTSIESFKRFLETNKDSLPALMISDLILEDGNFLSVLEQEWMMGMLKKQIPLVIVSSMEDISSLRYSYEAGASEYLTKPFKKNELLVKVENLLRSKGKLNKKFKPRPQIDGVIIDNLSSKQNQLLELFIEAPDRIVDRDKIINTIWAGMNVHGKVVDVHIYHLRRKLSDYGFTLKSLRGGQWELISTVIS
ncbi:MAG: response regulator transcription factor [Bdellovibrio sp.]